MREDLEAWQEEQRRKQEAYAQQRREHGSIVQAISATKFAK